MKTIHVTYPLSLEKEGIPETVAAIGFFDGIHKGHQAVIKKAAKEAEKRDMESAVITFHPHPSVIFSKDVVHVEYITPIPEKEKILRNFNIDRLYIIHFNKQLSQMEPQAFVDHFIIGLNIKHVVAGFDFTYGPKEKANMNTIGKHSHGSFTYTTIEKVEVNGKKVSSTAIRNYLKEGKIEEVNDLLTRPFRIDGEVVQGARRGHELGYPTANIAVSQDSLLPKKGIYAVKVRYGGKVYNGMASLGTNPTFTPDSHRLSLEVNILDFKQNLYGADLTVEWYKYIRPEKKFDNVDALIDEMKNDERTIRSYFGK
ncbi:MAG TPA: riboflavin biosynthesis protein RibF [Bacillota bacterium]|nr:riboflavin biosynthesis protein RibF [Bacillota bacterium]